jgi:aspartate racemase
VFGRRGIEVITPESDDREWVHDRYVNQLLNGVFKDEVKEEFTGLITRAQSERGIDGVILGGTELTILLVDSRIAGLPMLDTTALHVAAIVEHIA